MMTPFVGLRGEAPANRWGFSYYWREMEDRMQRRSEHPEQFDARKGLHKITE
jgi:hypothetical protein